jgi:predicted nucleic acid-binding protein
VIYLDSSVALAQLFAEDRAPPEEITAAPLVSSRLFEYEVWNRIHSRGLTDTHSDLVHTLLSRIVLIELSSAVLGRALKPFPVAVRTSDGLHLATIEYLRAKREEIQLASYDRRQITCAQALGISIYPL